VPGALLREVGSRLLPPWLRGDLAPAPARGAHAPEFVAEANGSECAFPDAARAGGPGFMVLDHAYAFSDAAVVGTERFLFATGGCVGRRPRAFPPLAAAAVVPDAIVVFHPFPRCYGHLLGEVFPAYHAIPAGAWARSVLFLPRGTLGAVLLELLAICGKAPRAVRTLSRPVFARRLYVPRQWEFMVVWPEIVRAMRAAVLARLGPRAAPRNFVVAQRRVNRRIENVGELLAAAQRAHPADPWAILPEQPRTMRQQIALFTNTTLYVIVSGSGGANTVWMARNTVFIEIQTRACVASLLAVAHAVGVKVFETRSAYRGFVSFRVNVEFMLSIIQRGYDFMRLHPPVVDDDVAGN
jgi:capsular polysaccharide biosynthesis protein